MYRKNRWLIVFTIVILMLAVVGSALAAPADKTKEDTRTRYKAVLTTDESGNVTPAKGFSFLRVAGDKESARFSLRVKMITDVNVAHIHVSATPGASGPPAVFLYPSAPPPVLIPGEFSGLLSSGTFTNANFVNVAATGVDTIAELEMAIAEGRAYVNVHTLVFPAGEISGWLVKAK